MYSIEWKDICVIDISASESWDCLLLLYISSQVFWVLVLLFTLIFSCHLRTNSQSSAQFSLWTDMIDIITVYKITHQTIFRILGTHQIMYMYRTEEKKLSGFWILFNIILMVTGTLPNNKRLDQQLLEWKILMILYGGVHAYCILFL